MTPLDRCPKCGVPGHITSEHTWLDNGIIVQSRDSRNRMVLADQNSIEPVFQGIEKIIGVPIEQILIAAKRKAVKPYLAGLIPKMTLELLRKRAMSWKPINDSLINQAALTGYGKYHVVDYRFEGDGKDYIIENISEPYSVALAAGDMTGAFELLFDCSLATECKQISDDVYQLKAYAAEHDEGQEGRLPFRSFRLKPGNIELERCEICGGPLALSRYAWYPERGLIFSKGNGIRIVLTGMELDAIFAELERELGDEIPRAVIEAKRRVTRSGPYWIQGMRRDDMRLEMALRGVGNMVELHSDEKGMRIKIENCFLHLIEIGMVQGLYEKAFNVDTEVEWEFSEDGTLEAEVHPIK
jgi:hypothetical protein